MAKRSKKEVEAIISGAGLFMDLVIILVAAVKKFGGTMGQLHKLVTPEGRETLEKVARIIAGFAEATTYKVAECFTNKSLFYYRDGDLDKWLPATLPTKVGSLSHKETTGGQTFRQMAEAITGTSGKSDEELAKLLVEQGKTCSLQQIEDAIVRHEAGDKSDGLLDNGRANFFFVWSGSAMVVVSADRLDGGWNVRVDSFGLGFRWYAGYRVFFCN